MFNKNKKTCHKNKAGKANECTTRIYDSWHMYYNRGSKPEVSAT